MTLDRLKDLFADRAVVGVQEGAVGRIFVRCHDCKRVVPAWRLLKTKPSDGATGCDCGSMHVAPFVAPFLTAAWWLFVRGILIRKWMLRLSDNWDPRIPHRRIA